MAPSTNCHCLMLQFTITLLLLLCVDSTPLLQPNMRSQALEPRHDLPPLMPFTNVSVPKLSGRCPLNFSKAENLVTTTAIDCWSPLAPYLANTVCCAQLQATITILIAQSSPSSRTLAVNETHADDCLSDIAQVFQAQGSTNRLLELCSIHPSTLTRASCPVASVTDVENVLDGSRVLEFCGRVDTVKECRHKACQSAITDAAVKIASANYSVADMVGDRDRDREAMVDDCKEIVLRWLASKVDSSNASKVLRGISSCKINEVCPLVFPDPKNVSKECGGMIRNPTACCLAMKNYITQLQVQSFVTNLQAFTCASSLAKNLQKANVSSNVYNMCHVKLKDFSLQVGSQDSGCLFPSLPFDVTYDQSSGIIFKCDLNDNVAAPWPSAYAYSPAPSSSTNVSGIDLPALPRAASDQSVLISKGLRSNLFISTLMVLNLFI